MAAVRSPEASFWCHDGNDRVKETSGLVDYISEPLVVSVGEITLEWCGLNSLDGKDGHYRGVAAKRFLIQADYTTACFLDRSRGLGHKSLGALQASFFRMKAFGTGLGFPRTTAGS